MRGSTNTMKARKPTITTKLSKSPSSTLALAEGARKRRHRILKPAKRDPYIELLEERKRREAAARRRGRPLPRARCVNCGNPVQHRSIGGGTVTNAVFAHRIPERLQHPDLEDLSPGAYPQTGRDPVMELDGLQLARNVLGVYGQELFSAVKSTVLSPIHATHSHELPPFMTIALPKTRRPEHMPTHVLALHDGNPEVKKRKVHLVPIHAQVLAAYCSRVPPLPTPSPPSPSLDPGDIYFYSREVPLIPFCIPSPDTFPLMMQYLYTQDSALLFRNLVPVGPSSGGMWDGDFSRIPDVLAETYTNSTLFSMTLRVYGIWQNACSLGVLNPQIWQVIDLAWKNHRNALSQARQ